MESRTLVFAALAVLVAGYAVYGRLVARILGVDPARTTPAHERFDGIDYVPAKSWLVLFGHHFSSICAAGPIVGPVIAVAYWGYGVSVVWILLGAVFLGAVADFSSLVVAVRHGGVSISEVAGQVVTPRARILFSTFILVALVLVLAVFAELAAGTFVEKPGIVLPSLGILPVAALAGFAMYSGAGSRLRVPLVTVAGLAALGALMGGGTLIPVELPPVLGVSPHAIWIVVLLGYCLVASVLPVQALLQPRDYLSSFVLFATIGIGVAGAIWSSPDMNAPAATGFMPSDWPGAGPLWPMLFVTIACGAISGFHSVVSSGTTCKQLGSEAHACRIGYGAMLLESLVAVLVVVCVGAGLTRVEHRELLVAPGGAIGAFGAGYGNITSAILGDYGEPFAVMALNFFILTTLDTATRLGRYLLSELIGLRGRVLPALTIVAAAGALALSGKWRALWPAFGASNQLVAGLSLLVVACWLMQRGRPHLPLLIPAVLMLVTTVGAFFWQIAAVVNSDDPNWLIAAIDVLLVVLAGFVLTEAWELLRRSSRSARDA